MTDLRSGAKGVAAGEKSKNQLSRDFRRRPIFDFCSSIGHKQKRLPNVVMSASVPYCRTLDTRIETRKGRPMAEISIVLISIMKMAHHTG
jgi:hypothetical protein